LRYVIFGGEALELWRLEDWYQHRSDHFPLLVNMYGITETTVHVSHVVLDQQVVRQEHRSLIGQGIPDLRVYVLDGGLQVVPVGVGGELYIAGAGLARGYLRRAGLTGERFVADPYGEAGTRMYRSGDMARWRGDGVLEYLGRSDQQVKVRGFRIELGEIESALQQQAGVVQAVVVVREDRAGEKRLVGYVVGEPGVEVGELRRGVGERLPDYMVPAAIVRLERLPLSPNGKLDRKALPAPEYQSGQAYRAPRTPQEEVLCALFAEVLGLSRVGLDDNFFELGGHSLLATRLISRARGTLGVELSIRSLFEAPSVAALVERVREAQQARVPLQAMVRPEEIPLSYAQRRLWFLNRLEGANATYNIPVAVRLGGILQVEALAAALGDVVERHESLRTVFPEKLGVPRQQVLSIAEARLRVAVRAVREGEKEAALREVVEQGFDLGWEIPLRAQLFALGTEEHVLVVVMHHIASDGWSMGPLMRDIAEAYTARCRGEAPGWAPLRVQYADYTLWQQEVLGEESDPESVLAQQLGYWQRVLAGLPEQLELPSDWPRPAQASYRGGVVGLRLSAQLHGRLLTMARENQVSLFMVLQAGLAGLLSRLGAGSDIPLGSTIAGRTDRALEELVGFFVNTLVLRTDTGGNPGFLELLERVRGVNLDAYAHQEMPFERLVEVLNPARSLARHPLFQVMLTFQNVPEAGFHLPGLSTSVEGMGVGVAKFDLSFSLGEQRGAGGVAEGIAGVIEYSTDLFTRETVERIGERLERLLEAVAEDGERRLGSIELLSEGERAQILEEWNGTRESVPMGSLPELFEEQAGRRGEATAVVFQEQSLSYGELNQRANQVAHRLRAEGIGPEDVVALALPRSLEMVVSLLGIVKSGAAYLPLDPEYPTERLRFMLEDAQPALLLSTRELARRLPTAGCRSWLLDEEQSAAELAAQPRSNLSQSQRCQPLLPQHPAYVIYTSGSTGTPKGVVIAQQNVIRLFKATEQWFHFDSKDTWTLFHSYAFDFSVWELWGPFLYGGRLVVVPYLLSRTPVEFLHFLATYGVTVLNQTPSAFYQLMES